jgi:hypothetical protein
MASAKAWAGLLLLTAIGLMPGGSEYNTIT